MYEPEQSIVQVNMLAERFQRFRDACVAFIAEGNRAGVRGGLALVEPLVCWV